MSMVTAVYEHEYLNDYNKAHDISLLFMCVDSIHDRQYISMIYNITMIKRKVWNFNHCIDRSWTNMVLDVHFIPIVVTFYIIVYINIISACWYGSRTVPSVPSALLFIPLFTICEIIYPVLTL